MQIEAGAHAALWPGKAFGCNWTDGGQSLSEDTPSNRGPLVALILVAVLVAGGLWLSSHLRASSQIQDCVMAGRTNCAPIQVPQKG